ncbi:hypothetical protein [Pseudomonas sp. 58 R 3]|nr:hypothetical protein [Pseudomonas sp. 58 R 3]
MLGCVYGFAPFLRPTYRLIYFNKSAYFPEDEQKAESRSFSSLLFNFRTTTLRTRSSTLFFELIRELFNFPKIFAKLVNYFWISLPELLTSNTCVSLITSHNSTQEVILGI